MSFFFWPSYQTHMPKSGLYLSSLTHELLKRNQMNEFSVCLFAITNIISILTESHINQVRKYNQLLQYRMSLDYYRLGRLYKLHCVVSPYDMQLHRSIKLIGKFISFCLLQPNVTLVKTFDSLFVDYKRFFLLFSSEAVVYFKTFI